MATRSGIPALTMFRTEVLPTLSGKPPLQVREEVRDDPSGLALERAYALHLGGELGLEVRGQVDDSGVIVLGRAGFEPQRFRFKVKLAAFQCENLALRAPAERVGQSHGHLQVREQVSADCFVPFPFEEALPRAVFLEQPDDRQCKSSPFS